MEKLTYVTGNYGKYISVKNTFEELNIEIDFFKYDLEELNINDIEQISKDKALQAYKILGSPCFVKDSGFYIDAYPGRPGYPGAFAKRSGISKNIEELLETMKNIKNRNCKFIDCLTFYDGNEFYTFFGISKGSLSTSIKGANQEKQYSNLWKVFIPKNCTKTMAEMTDEERKNRNDEHTSATILFANWYKENYINKLTLKK